MLFLVARYSGKLKKFRKILVLLDKIIFMSVIEQIHPLVTRRLRQEVLYPNEPIEHIILEEDDNGIHFGLYDNSKLISVISLFFKGKEAQFRKFATDSNYQGQGYGTELLRFIINYAEDQGVTEIWCHARLSAVNFYHKHGLITKNGPYKRNGIEYIHMSKSLNL